MIEKIYGIRFLCGSKLFFKLLFREGFDVLQIINMIDDIYSNLYSGKTYYIEVLSESKLLLKDSKCWCNIDKETFHKFLKNEEKVFEIGFSNIIENDV